MRFQINAFITIFLKKLKWYYLVLFLFLMLFYIFDTYYSMGEITRENILNVLAIFYKYDNLKKISLLYFVFQYFLTFYTTYCLFLYENNNSPEFMLLRINPIKNYLYKFVISNIFCIFIRTLFFVCTLFFYAKLETFYFSDYILCIGYHCLLIFIYFLLQVCYYIIKIRKKL